MPTTPYAKLLLSTGGAPTSGGLTLNVGDVVQLSAESTVGWTQQRYEIWSGMALFPLTCPAGWSTDATSGVFYYSTTSTPPPFTLPAGWGKLLLRLRVNNGANGTTLCDDSTAIQVIPTTGILDIAWGETDQFSVSEKWIAAWRSDVRLFNTAIGGGIVPTSLLFTATSPLRVNGGAAADLTGPQTWSILASSGAIPGSMSAAHYTLVNGATATPTASKIAMWGASIELGAAYFWEQNYAGSLANTGLIRVGNGPTIVLGGHATTGTANRRLMAWDAAELQVGVDADIVDIDGASAAALGVGGTRGVWCTANGVQFFSGGSEEFAGGVGVLGITDATTAPTTVPGAGNIVVWGKTGQIKAVGPKGVVYSLSADVPSAQTLSIADVIWWSVQTTNATATPVATYGTAVPAGGQFAIEVWVMGIKTGTDLRTAYKMLCTGGRAPAGSTTVDATSATVIVDNIGVAGPPTVTITTNATTINARGEATSTIEWTVEGTIRIWKP